MDPTYLIVDDSMVERMLLRQLLKRVVGPKITVHEAITARDALDVVAQKAPDVVFLDMLLEGGPGGLHVLSVIRRTAPDTRVLLVTGLPADHPRVTRSMGLGAHAFLPKPVSGDSLRAALGP